MTREAGADAATAVPPARSNRVLAILPVAIFALLAGLFLVRLYSGDPAQLPSALVGRPAPPIDLPPLSELSDAAGRPVPGLASADLKGRITLLNVWASWCGPCRIEHPLLVALARDPALRLVGINYKDKPETARRFLGTFGNPFAAVGVDEAGRAGIDLGVYGVPETFVIGPDGTVRHRHVGPLTPETIGDFLAKVRAAR